MRGYDRVGSVVPYGEVAITQDDAARFLSSALDGVKIEKLRVDQYSFEVTTSTYTSGILSDASSDYEVTEESCMSKTTFGCAPNYWHSKMLFARYSQKNHDAKIYNLYEVESIDGELMMARREVRVIRSLSRIAIDGGDLEEEVYDRQHKMFEVPLSADDIDLVVERKDRTMRRRVATGR